MAGPTTTFDADECQALLDLIDRLRDADDKLRLLGLGELMLAPLRSNQRQADEEAAAYAKLREAGKFYVR